MEKLTKKIALVAATLMITSCGGSSGDESTVSGIIGIPDLPIALQAGETVCSDTSTADDGYVVRVSHGKQTILTVEQSTFVGETSLTLEKTQFVQGNPQHYSKKVQDADGKTTRRVLVMLKRSEDSILRADVTNVYYKDSAESHTTVKKGISCVEPQNSSSVENRNETYTSKVSLDTLSLPEPNSKASCQIPGSMCTFEYTCINKDEVIGITSGLTGMYTGPAYQALESCRELSVEKGLFAADARVE